MAYDVEGKGELIIFLSAVKLTTNKSFLGGSVRCILQAGSPHEF